MIVREQALVFAAMGLCGFALGALYDLLGGLRRLLRAGQAITGALDVLFGLAFAAGVTAAALRLHTEAFRLYTLLGTALGMVLYAAAVGMPVRILYGAVERCVKKSKKRTEKSGTLAGKWKTGANI